MSGARDPSGWEHGAPSSGYFGRRSGALEQVFDEARDAEYAEALGRCHDFHAELYKERDVGNLIFAELEGKEEELAKLEAWVHQLRARERSGAPLLGKVGR